MKAQSGAMLQISNYRIKRVRDLKWKPTCSSYSLQGYSRTSVIQHWWDQDPLDMWNCWLCEAL